MEKEREREREREKEKARLVFDKLKPGRIKGGKNYTSETWMRQLETVIPLWRKFVNY